MERGARLVQGHSPGPAAGGALAGCIPTTASMPASPAIGSPPAQPQAALPLAFSLCSREAPPNPPASGLGPAPPRPAGSAARRPGGSARVRRHQRQTPVAIGQPRRQRWQRSLARVCVWGGGARASSSRQGSWGGGAACWAGRHACTCLPEAGEAAEDRAQVSHGAEAVHDHKLRGGGSGRGGGPARAASTATARGCSFRCSSCCAAPARRGDALPPEHCAQVQPTHL